MRDILIVTKFTLIEALKQKAFIVSTIIMILMIVLASAFTKIIPKLANNNEKDKEQRRTDTKTTGRGVI